MGRAVEKQVRWFWRFVMMPLLFGLVGTSVDLKTLDTSIIPRACAIVVSGQTPQDLLSQVSSRNSRGGAAECYGHGSVMMSCLIHLYPALDTAFLSLCHLQAWLCGCQ